MFDSFYLRPVARHLLCVLDPILDRYASRQIDVSNYKYVLTVLALLLNVRIDNRCFVDRSIAFSYWNVGTRSSVNLSNKCIDRNKMFTKSNKIIKLELAYTN